MIILVFYDVQMSSVSLCVLQLVVCYGSYALFGFKRFVFGLAVVTITEHGELTVGLQTRCCLLYDASDSRYRNTARGALQCGPGGPEFWLGGPQCIWPHQ